MNVGDVARRVASIAGLLRRSVLWVMAVNAFGVLLMFAGFWRFGWPIAGVLFAVVMLVPTLGLWQFRKSLASVVALPADLAARSGSREELGASVSNVADAVVSADRSVLGFARLARELKAQVDVLADTNVGAALEGLRAVQPARLSAAAGATGLAFASSFFGGLVFVAALLFG